MIDDGWMVGYKIRGCGNVQWSGVMSVRKERHDQERMMVDLKAKVGKES
jgi:hypothetical protein